MATTRVTVVIPTRERPDVLEKCIRTVTNQEYENLEIIVSDNFSAPATEAIVRSFKDPRIRYVNPGKRVSMSHNFEFAISTVEEGWIAVVGDDDGLLPNSLRRVVRILEDSGLEALASSTCVYRWPSRDAPSGTVLSVPMNRGEKVVDARRALRRLMDWTLDRLVMPQLYTGGLVSAALVKRIRDVNGSFFQSQIPDVYSGVAICSVVDKFLFTREPFAINGRSKHSNGAALFRLEETPFLSEGNIPFHPDIPLPRSGTLTFSLPALVYDCYLQSSYLRDDRVKVTPADQLKLILSETQVGRDLLDEWSEKFAAHHGIDLREMLVEAKRRPFRRQFSQVYEKLADLFERYRVDSAQGLAIGDVFEASIMAATILSTRPGRLSTVGRKVFDQGRKRFRRHNRREVTDLPEWRKSKS